MKKQNVFIYDWTKSVHSNWVSMGNFVHSWNSKRKTTAGKIAKPKAQPQPKTKLVKKISTNRYHYFSVDGKN